MFKPIESAIEYSCATEDTRGVYNIGEVWWTQFPFEDTDGDKHRPAIVIDDDTIAVLAMMVSILLIFMLSVNLIKVKRYS